MITPQTVHDMIVKAGERQLRASSIAATLLAKGVLPSELSDLLYQIAANSANTVANTAHEGAAGALCSEGPDGCCSSCGVEMTLCPACHGVGYHKSGCASDSESTR